MFGYLFLSFPHINNVDQNSTLLFSSVYCQIDIFPSKKKKKKDTEEKMMETDLFYFEKYRKITVTKVEIVVEKRKKHRATKRLCSHITTKTKCNKRPTIHKRGNTQNYINVNLLIYSLHCNGLVLLNSACYSLLYR